MNVSDPTIAADRPLLRAAHAAVAGGDLQRADALFLEHLAGSRDDALALAGYAEFCLRTGRAERATWLFHRASALGRDDADLLGELGYAWLELQDDASARRAFEAALARSPTHARANYGLATCRRQAGEWPQAVAAYERSLAAQPDTVPILLDLVESCLKAADPARARMHAEHALAIAPDEPTVLLECAKCLRETGALAEAIRSFERCRALQPGEPDVLVETARCLRAMNQLRPAIALLEQFNKLAPGRAEYHEEMGHCLQLPTERAARDRHWGIGADLWIRQDRLDDAEALLERMQVSSSSYVITWIMTGILHVARHQDDLAEAAFARAIETDRHWIDGYANLANTSEQTNRIEQAAATAERGLRIAEARADAPASSVKVLQLVSAKVARRRKEYARAMECLDRFDRMPLSDVERRTAAFERAAVLDLLGRTDEAIATFERANALARAPWDRAHPGSNTYVQGVDYMRSLLASGWTATWRAIAQAAEGRQPVFLLGFPRSGTTLLNQILYTHGAVRTLEEKLPVQRMRDAVRSMPQGYPHAIAQLDGIDIAFLRERYFAEAALQGDDDPAKLLVDKFPLHSTMAGLIHRVFPGSRFVFAIRHPCDVVLSCFMRDFRTNDAMANFFTLADAVRFYVGTMELWQAYRARLPLVVHDVRYEDVVDDFEGQVRGLCDFLGIAWEEGLRQFSTRALDRGRIHTPSYDQVSKPIYREARYRWERYRKHLAPYLPALRPWIERFGYPDPDGPA
jgi:tetratricopeptide (TPR) repeat protein